MARETPITIYVEQDEKQSLQRDADRQGKSLSSHVYDLMQAERNRETTDERMRELNAEERLEALVADIKEIQSRAGVYAVANFELLKQQYPDGVRQQALETGSRRLRDPDVIPAPAPTADESPSADTSEVASQERTNKESEADNDRADEDEDYNIFDDLRPRNEAKSKDEGEQTDADEGTEDDPLAKDGDEDRTESERRDRGFFDKLRSGRD